jgi:glycosyltransferase involved in cell wall biosynthesis
MVDTLQLQPLFSIVIPVRNRQNLVPSAVESVLTQTFQNFEIIIVDDGSDNPILMPDAAINDQRVRLMRQPPLGANAARNGGIKQSRGRFIAFLDVDDQFLPEKLENIASAVEGGRVWFSHFSMVKRDDNVFATRPKRAPLKKETVGEYVLKNGQFLQTSTLVVHKDLAIKVLFDETLKKFQDIDFVIRLSKISPYPIFIPKVLSVWGDVHDRARISQGLYPEAAIDFYHKLETLVGKSERSAYAANMLGYEISKKHPFKASGLVINGLIGKHINGRSALRQMARIWLSQRVYRKIVNHYLKGTIKIKVFARII